MLVKWLYGYRKVFCEKGYGIRVLNVMLRNNIGYWGLKRGEDERFEFSLLEKDYKNLLSLLDKYQLRVYSVKGRGLPFICKAHKNRAGLLVGLFLFFILLLSSSLFIWEVKVVSDTDIPHNEILANLKTLGCFEGSFVPSIDFEDLCIDYVNKYKDCSWISVNLKGTVAYVEIQDKRIYDELNSTPRNLVAGYDGIIESFSVYSGKSMVESGSVVKKGDILVSGIVDSKHGEVRLCRADAEVKALVELTFCEEVMYSYKKQVFTDRECEKKSLRFFDLTLPLSLEATPDYCEYTTSRESNGAVVFDVIELPLSIEKEVMREYIVEDFTYTPDEAERVAEARMKKRIEGELFSSEIISIETNGENTKDSYILTCKIKCRLDIAMPKDIKTQ